MARESCTSQESQSFMDMTRGFTKAIENMSTMNVEIPRAENYKDIYKFLSEYETETAVLTDDQKVRLLVKAFPSGTHKVWYDAEIKPNIEIYLNNWGKVKQKIIDRYAIANTKDRYFRRLRDLKFNTDGDHSLYDYIEEFNHVLGHTIQNMNDEAKVRYIKSTLPEAVIQKLEMISGFESALTVVDLQKTARRYDTLNLGKCNEQRNRDSPKTAEILKSIEVLLTGIKEEGKSTRECIAALRDRPSRANSPYFSDRQARQTYQGYQGNNSNQSTNYHSIRQRSISPYNGQRDLRPQSPGRNFVDRNGNNQQPRSPYGNGNHATFDNSKGQSNFHENDVNKQNIMPRAGESNQVRDGGCQAFDSEEYWQRYGRPKNPCLCGLYHWNQHCVKAGNLKFTPLN